MADMRGRPKVIVIQTTSTESLSRSVLTLEPASTLTGHHPGKAITRITTEQTKVPIVIIMQIMPSTLEDTMDTMTPDIEDTMTSPTGLMMIAEGETATAINLCILPGRLAMRTSGSTILVTMLALMRTTVVREMLMVMTLTGAVSTVNSQSTAPTVTTADGVASAHDRNRAKCTGASLTWCQQHMITHHPLWLWITPMGSTQIRLMHLTTIASTIPLGIPPKAPGTPLSSPLLVLQPQKSSPYHTAVLVLDLVDILFRFCQICPQQDSLL